MSCSNKQMLFYASLVFATTGHAAAPVWTFSSPNPSIVNVSRGQTATVQYTVTNQSAKAKNLILKPTPGLSASSCQLPGKGSTCNLTLTVDGSAFPATGIHSGPILCEQGNSSQCYQPSLSQQLNINVANASNGINIYIATDSSLILYSPDRAVSLGVLPSPQNDWSGSVNSLSKLTSAISVSSDGTFYIATGIHGETASGSGAATLIHSQDGVHWSQVVNTLPSGGEDQATALFALDTTVYVGTANGYVFSTDDYGATWQHHTATQVPDAGTITTLVVDSENIYYAGTSRGNVYYSTNAGRSWVALANQPFNGTEVDSLAIDKKGTLYAVNTSSGMESLYNNNPQSTGVWQQITPPAGNTEFGSATSISVMDNTVYVGTDEGALVSTSDLGMHWSTIVPPSGNGIGSMVITPKESLSPVFVEAYGSLQLTGNRISNTMTVANFSSATASNVRPDPSQLPAGVSSSSCASVNAGGTCTLTLTAANTTAAFAPTAFDVIDANNKVISRAALVSMISPNNGNNYYYVYAVDETHAYIVDNADVHNSARWGSTSTKGIDYTPIWGSAESSTNLSPYPNAASGATQYSGQNNCLGATDGACNSANILEYYNNIIADPPVNLSYYAAGLCAQSTAGGANAGDWYLPSFCELHGNIYYNSLDFNLYSCPSISTGILNLFNLSYFGGPLKLLVTQDSDFWSSTESAAYPVSSAWEQYIKRDGGSQQSTSTKNHEKNVRCVRALTL